MTLSLVFLLFYKIYQVEGVESWVRVDLHIVAIASLCFLDENHIDLACAAKVEESHVYQRSLS